MPHPPCRTCPYWEPVDGPGSTFGTCRVNPPVAGVTSLLRPLEPLGEHEACPELIAVAQWPVTLPIHWCSSHPQSREWVAAWEVEQIQKGREAEEQTLQ
jgi:hypothetical protein